MKKTALPCSIKSHLIPVFLGVAALFTTPRGAAADEFDQFMQAKAAYDTGNYAEAVSRFTQLIETGLSNPALAIECYKLTAVSCLFINANDQAEHHFSELLTLSPTYSLDPMMFPIEVIDFFLKVKEKNKERLAALTQVRLEDQKRQRRLEEAKRKSQCEKLRRNVYFEQNRKQHSLLVAFMPFGAGQFQNGHKIKGAAFLTGELLLSGAAVTSFILHEQLRNQSTEPFTSSEQKEDYKRLESIYRITNQASLVGLAVVAAVGIIDSLYSYQSEVVVWSRLPEKEVPKKIRPKPPKPSVTIAPSIDQHSAGLSILGRF